jgi:hypothetical protein
MRTLQPETSRVKVALLYSDTGYGRQGKDHHSALPKYYKRCAGLWPVWQMITERAAKRKCTCDEEAWYQDQLRLQGKSRVYHSVSLS